jgi:chemotaxis signal transduction protein
MGERDLAGRLDEIREVVRASGVEAMPGMRAPVTGVLVLRGSPLPVVDLRGDDNVAGDVLVLAAEGRGALGVAVDKVVAVLADDALTLDDAPLAEEMPSYVKGVLRGANGSPVLLVEVARFAGMGDPGPVGGIPQPRRTASSGPRRP